MKKQTKEKKPKKISPKKLQELIWIECKRIIRARYKNECYTCGANKLFGSNNQTGHLIAKGYLKNYLKYDLRLLRPQCSRCNLWFGGMGALFIENMREIEGDMYVAEILKDLKKEIPAKEVYQYYVELLERLIIIKK